MKKTKYVRAIGERRSKEITQWNTFLPRAEVPFESQRERWQLKSPRMKKFVEKERMGKKGVGFAIRRRRAYRGEVKY